MSSYLFASYISYRFVKIQKIITNTSVVYLFYVKRTSTLYLTPVYF